MGVKLPRIDLVHEVGPSKTGVRARKSQQLALPHGAALPPGVRPHINTTSPEYLELTAHFVDNLDFAALDQIDRKILEDALHLMLDYYSHQPEIKDQDPIQHLVSVAKRVASWGGTPLLAAAAIVHMLPLETVLAGEVDESVILIVREKKVLSSLLHLPLDEDKTTAEEWGYLTKLCLMEPLNSQTWLLEAADAFCSLYSSEQENGQMASYAKRSFHVVPVALRLLNMEEIAIALENLSFMHLDRKAYAETEDLITLLNGRERAEALNHLRELTNLISIELYAAQHPHRVEVDIKSVVSTRNKIAAEGELGLTDTSRFRYILDGNPSICRSVAAIIIEEMRKIGYTLNIAETRNFIKDLPIAGLPYETEDGSAAVIDNTHDFGPKPNGYQSIHLAFCDKYGAPINVQIRTREMHENATIGSSAHAISYKLDDFLKGASVSDGQDPIQAMRIEQRRYAIYNGRIYRLIPYPPGQGQIASPLDLVFAASEAMDAAFKTPNQVRIIRIDRRTGKRLDLKVSRGAPLMNGDILLEETAPHAIARAKQLLPDSHTYFAQLALGLARKKQLTIGRSASEAQSVGFRQIHAIVGPFETALAAEFENAYSRMVSRNVPQISVHYSLERVALAMNIGSFSRLQSLIGLSADSELIQVAIKEQLRLNSVAFLAGQYN